MQEGKARPVYTYQPYGIRREKKEKLSRTVESVAPYGMYSEVRTTSPKLKARTV